jgi:transketolase
MAENLNDWRELAAQLRVDSIRCTTKAGSGHPTSSMSAADLMAVLMAKYLHYDWSNPHHPNNDRLIFSKGHACPLLYSMFKAAGAITDDELLTLRKFGSRLEGHPNPHVLPWVDVATGSLGQGLAIGVGMALNAQRVDKLPYRAWVLLGDSEMAEGSVWEAFDKASYYKLNQLTAIIDMNRLGQRGETDLGWNSAAYAARARGFGWHAIELDGHDLPSIDRAFAEALAHGNQPTCLVAKTIKGYGVAAVTAKRSTKKWPRRPSRSWEGCGSAPFRRRSPKIARRLRQPRPNRYNSSDMRSAARKRRARRMATPWWRSAAIGRRWW